MSLKDIMAYPVPDLASPDCVLFLWTTDPMLTKALEVMEEWGFTYKTVGFYWAKMAKNGTFPMGTGYWSRANPEMCLLGTIGHPKRKNRNVRKLIVAPRREHSRKPDEIYSRIEQLVEGPYLELFSRTTAPEWQALGDETGRWRLTV